MKGIHKSLNSDQNKEIAAGRVLAEIIAIERGVAKAIREPARITSIERRESEVISDAFSEY